jgi:membrane protease YdiL (CAAX protease family)
LFVDLFPRLELLLLKGTAVGHAIDAHFALGALNLALRWAVPILLLLLAVRIKRLPARDYFAWVAPRPGYILIALSSGLALQVASYALVYLTGGDLTAPGVAQYRHALSVGSPVWLPLLMRWPSIIAAPLVEESIFRGFLWRGWEATRLGAAGTWLLISILFAAYHIQAVTGMAPFSAGIALFEDLLLGLLFGWLRWRSGSTLPGMAAHVAYNVIPPIATFMVGVLFA